MNIEVDNYANYKEKEISGRYITNNSIAALNSRYSSKICGYSVNNCLLILLQLVLGSLKC